MITTKEFLQKAKQVIVDNGWCRCTMQRNDGSCCMLGALGYVADNAADDYDLAEYNAEQLLRRVVPDRGIVRFNDAVGRTLDEVLAKFDEAIALAEEVAA